MAQPVNLVRPSLAAPGQGVPWLVVAAITLSLSLTLTAAEATARDISIHDEVTHGNATYRQALSYERGKVNYKLHGTNPDEFPDFCASLRFEIRQAEGWKSARSRGSCVQGIHPQHIDVSFRITLGKPKMRRFRRGTGRLQGGSDLGVSLILRR
jgi:hypothetical protein